MKVKITELKPESIWQHRSHEVIGMVVDAEIELTPIDSRSAWSLITPKEPFFNRHGVWCKYIEVPEPSAELLPCWRCGGEVFQWKNKYINTGLVTCKNSKCMPITENYTVDEWQNHPRLEPSAMSELSRWIDENGHAKCGCELVEKPASKKLTWIQKIRDYDHVVSEWLSWMKRHNDMFARCNAAEAMRDHYKTALESWESLAISKARELELMSKVADNWQAKLIAKNGVCNILESNTKDLAARVENIGKRLKFSIGHNHVEIIIGNPITLCSNYRTENKHGDYTDNAISRCSRKDAYDWKQGAIYSLDNLCDEHKYSQKLRRDLRKALAKKYPEVFK